MKNILVVLLAIVLLAACRGDRAPARDHAPAASLRTALRDVSLPAMTGVEPQLQERLRSRYASLTATREAPGSSDAELAQAYGEVAKLLIGANFFGDAEPFLMNARTLAPSDMAWPYYLAHSHRMRNDADQAIMYFEEALRLHPDYLGALVWAAVLHLDRGRPAAAMPLLEKAVALEPRSAAARFALGRAALATGNHGRAVEELEAALAADPQAKTVHYSLAMAYRGLGDQREAEEHLRQWEKGDVFPADPLMEEAGETLQTAVAYEIRGTRALDQQQWSEAAGLFRKGLEVAPRDATLYQNLGTALFLDGDVEGARRAFEVAVRLSPGYAKAHFSLGLVVEGAGRDAEAIDRFTAAMRFDPTLMTARFSLANALRRTGRVGESLEHYRVLFAADPSASQARFGYAMGLVRLGRYQEARDALEQGVSAHPEQPGFLHALARVLAAAPDDQVRDGRRALAIVERLVTQFGSTPAVSETFAMALAETGRFREAAARQREAMGEAVRQRRPDLAGYMKENLQLYEGGMPCRTPWRPDDPVHRPGAASGGAS